MQNNDDNKIKKDVKNLSKQIKESKSKDSAQNKFDLRNFSQKKDIASSKLWSLGNKSPKQKKRLNTNKSNQDYLDIEEPIVSEKKILEVELPSVELNEEEFNYVRFS